MIQTSLTCAFPGQGIQKIGMANCIKETNAWRFFQEANDILGYDLGKLCLEGPADVLNNTAYAQVAIYVTCFALWDLFKDLYQPHFFLGHSLGEITALGAAGAFSFGDGVRLVASRGRIMANNAQKGGMVAVLGLDLMSVQQLVEEIRPIHYVQVANENSPQQIVLSGVEEGLELLTKLALERGAKRVIRLNVSGPFHSHLMQSAAAELAHVVKDLKIVNCKIPVLSNDGETLLQEAERIRIELVEQITNPVRFIASVHKLVELGVKKFVEISPEALLIPLAKRIEPGLQFALVRDGGM